MWAHLAESAPADGAMEVKVVEVNLAVKVDGVGAAVTHERVGLGEKGAEAGGEARYWRPSTRPTKSTTGRERLSQCIGARGQWPVP